MTIITLPRFITCAVSVALVTVLPYHRQQSSNYADICMSPYVDSGVRCAVLVGSVCPLLSRVLARPFVWDGNKLGKPVINLHHLVCV